MTYANQYRIKFDSPDWKVINLKTLFPLLKQQSQKWRHVEPEMIKQGQGTLGHKVSKHISRMKYDSDKVR